MTNNYVKRVYEDLEKRNIHQPEFLQAVKEVFESIEPLIDSDNLYEQHSILERIVQPERIIEFKVTWMDKNDKLQVNTGYRVQFNSAIGPYKGGLRFHPSVNQSLVKFLGFEQVFKNGLTGLPMGAGKGGSDFNPRGKTDAEVRNFCHAFISELYRHIGEDTDVPAGDIGVGAREVGYMYGYYKKLQNTHTGVITGKGLSYGGSLVRKEATGYGLCYFVEEMLSTMKNDSFKNKKVAISGSGNVAIYAAEKAMELGATVIAMSDSSGYIIDESGIDLKAIKEIKEVNRERINKYLEYSKTAIFKDSTTSVFSTPCDICLPCAAQNEITLEVAEIMIKNNVIVVGEGANMPTTKDAMDLLLEKGVMIAPAKAGNAGGVAVSGLEMSQNSIRQFWSVEEVDNKLKDIMHHIFSVAYNTSIEMGVKGNLVIGANIAGFKKISKAMIEQAI